MICSDGEAWALAQASSVYRRDAVKTRGDAIGYCREQPRMNTENTNAESLRATGSSIKRVGTHRFK